MRKAADEIELFLDLEEAEASSNSQEPLLGHLELSACLIGLVYLRPATFRKPSVLV